MNAENLYLCIKWWEIHERIIWVLQKKTSSIYRTVEYIVFRLDLWEDLYEINELYNYID